LAGAGRPVEGVSIAVRQRGGFRRTVLFSLALLCALFGQVYLLRHRYPADGAVFYLAAIALFYGAVRGLPEAAPDAEVAAPGYSLRRSLPALALGLLSALFFWQNNSNAGIVLCLASSVTLAAAYWRQGLAASGKVALERWEWLALGGVLLLGLFMRLYHLASFPGTLYLDEGDFGSLALKLVRGGTYQAFVPDFTGHPTLFFYPLGYYLQLVGITIVKFRLYTIASSSRGRWFPSLPAWPCFSCCAPFARASRSPSSWRVSSWPGA
jgi:hypothetical protein